MSIAIARNQTPDSGDLDALVNQASGSLSDAVWSGKLLMWRFQLASFGSQLLGLIARDAVSFFMSERVTRLRLCEGNHCGWLFIDESRGKPRRWCSMSDCGNRSKARRAYARSKRQLQLEE